MIFSLHLGLPHDWEAAQVSGEGGDRGHVLWYSDQAAAATPGALPPTWR